MKNTEYAKNHSYNSSKRNEKKSGPRVVFLEPHCEIIDMGDMLLFISALAVVYIVPGPDMLLIFQSSGPKQLKNSLAVIAGLATARAIHVTIASAGLMALLEKSPFLYETIRLIGAAYLVWLGYKLFNAKNLTETLDNASNSELRKLIPAYIRGLLTNITNPKALLFCSVLLPQFVIPGSLNTSYQFFILGLTLVTTGIIFDLGFVAIGRSVGAIIKNSPTAKILQRWIMPSFFVGLGIRVALSS